MNIEELVVRNRSYRRFNEARALTRDELLALVNLARRAASGGNLQPLKYIVSCDPPANGRIFACLKWANALKDWDGPAEGERPGGYIVLLLDKAIASNAGCDHGIAGQTILLGAVERGLGGCMMGAIDRPALFETLGLNRERYDILLVIALGEPAETCVLEEMKPGGTVAYYRDDESVHHVPKRSLEEICLDI